jgi:hypothetical protein
LQVLRQLDADADADVAAKKAQLAAQVKQKEDAQNKLAEAKRRLAHLEQVQTQQEKNALERNLAAAAKLTEKYDASGQEAQTRVVDMDSKKKLSAELVNSLRVEAEATTATLKEAVEIDQKLRNAILQIRLREEQEAQEKDKQAPAAITVAAANEVAHAEKMANRGKKDKNRVRFNDIVQEKSDDGGKDDDDNDEETEQVTPLLSQDLANMQNDSNQEEEQEEQDNDVSAANAKRRRVEQEELWALAKPSNVAAKHALASSSITSNEITQLAQLLAPIRRKIYAHGTPAQKQTLANMMVTRGAAFERVATTEVIDRDLRVAFFNEGVSLAKIIGTLALYLCHSIRPTGSTNSKKKASAFGEDASDILTIGLALRLLGKAVPRLRYALSAGRLEKMQEVVNYLAEKDSQIHALALQVASSTIPRFLVRAYKLAMIDGFYDTCDNAGQQWSWERAWQHDLLEGAPKISDVDSPTFEAVFEQARYQLQIYWRTAGEIQGDDSE